MNSIIQNETTRTKIEPQFVSSAVHPYRDALLGVRFRATESKEVRSRVDAQHREILAAVENQDEDLAVSLMQAHMAQTREDILAAVRAAAAERSALSPTVTTRLVGAARASGRGGASGRGAGTGRDPGAEAPVTLSPREREVLNGPSWSS